MANIIEKIFRVDQRTIKKYFKQERKVETFAEAMSKKTDEELRNKTVEFKDRLSKGETLDEIKFEAFAVVREAAKRVLGLYPFPCQIIGGLVLNDGNVAEMRTGEGKTLTATMPVYLNALSGKGCYVVTVNEYLAQRDSNEMGQVYRWLGLTVGCNLHSLNTMEKKHVHRCDVCYTINSELGFDYLRDNMAPTREQRVLRGLNFCIVDEADSVLIDESRTPLIISGGAKATASQYTVADRFVKMLTASTPVDDIFKNKHPDYIPDGDFEVDVKTKSCNLTDTGVDKAEKLFGVPNLYAPQLQDLVHRIHQALKANFTMSRDVEYLVDQNNEIQLIDQFTGRVLKGREYSDGLQQAIQAKEGVKIKEETVTLATITYQNFFRLFSKIGGMTGTAKTEEEEFQKIYNMRVICIPTNKPVIREDATDYVFATKPSKIKAMVVEITERHEKGQPILIGTPSVEASEELAKYLREAKLPFEMLNAKNNIKEAEIISHAGEFKHITLATNMAGRGTDIKLTPETRALGGLCVFGLERHESRRIDNQLRGRSGRQGDPGFSRFYVSLDDELMIRFASDQLRKAFEGYGDEAIESRMLSNAITGAQKRIEGQNFDVRKNLLDYDDVMSKQRQIMYAKRDKILYADSINELLLDTFNDCGQALSKRSVLEKSSSKNVNGASLVSICEPRFLEPGSLKPALYDDADPKEVGEDLSDLLLEHYNSLKKNWPKEEIDKMERSITLRCIDRNWTQQIDNMTRFRESVGLRGYGQINPLQDYVNEGWGMFREMLEVIALEVVLNLMSVKIQPKEEVKKDAFTVEVQQPQGTPIAAPEETEKLKVVSTEDAKKAKLNISDIDKEKKVAVEHNYDDIHTN